MDRYAIGREEYFQFALGEQMLTGIAPAEAGEVAQVGASEVVRFACDEMRFFKPDGARLRAS